MNWQWDVENGQAQSRVPSRPAVAFLRVLPVLVLVAAASTGVVLGLATLSGRSQPLELPSAVEQPAASPPPSPARSLAAASSGLPVPSPEAATPTQREATPDPALVQLQERVSQLQVSVDSLQKENDALRRQLQERSTQSLPEEPSFAATPAPPPPSPTAPSPSPTPPPPATPVWQLDTAAGTVLGEGQTWVHQGLQLTLDATTRQVNLIYLNFTCRNLTGQPLEQRVTDGHLRAQDSLGGPWAPTFWPSGMTILQVAPGQSKKIVAEMWTGKNTLDDAALKSIQVELVDNGFCGAQGAKWTIQFN